MSADQRPAESANHQWTVDDAAAVTAQLGQAHSEHAKAMAAPAGATDRSGERPAAMDLPPVPDAESKHTGPA